MTKRRTVTRLCEHGAPKDTFDRETNNNVDRAQPITVQQQTRSSRNTTVKMKAKQQQQHQTPPLRRSSRIRNRTATLATTVTNTNDDRQSDHTTKTKERTKNVDNSSSIAEHEESTGHHMDSKNFRVVWRDSNVYCLLIKESLIIKAHEPRLNRTTHSVPLLVFPEGLERHLVPDPNGWPFYPFSLSIEQKTPREAKNRRRRRRIPMTIQTTNEHAYFPRSCRHHPAEREDYSSPADHALLFWSIISTLSSSSVPTLTSMCFFVRFYQCVFTNVCVCVCGVCRSLSLYHHRSVSLFLSSSLSPLDVTSLLVVVVWVFVFSSLVLVVSLENGCIDSRNVENLILNKYVLQRRCYLLIHFDIQSPWIHSSDHLSRWRKKIARGGMHQCSRRRRTFNTSTSSFASDPWVQCTREWIVNLIWLLFLSSCPF